MRKQEEIDYIELGEQTKQAREELFEILRLSKGLPKAITQHIKESIYELDSFRCKTENYMFSKEPEQTINVFYGPRLNKTIQPEDEQ